MEEDDMGYHHLAIATKDTKANHDFYTKAMGFSLDHCEAGPTQEGGWVKHFFYNTGDGSMIAFWEMHIEEYPAESYNTSIADGLGLPHWTNHIAFSAKDLSELEEHRKRWVEYGCEVRQLDHRWCRSIYTEDPNGIMVEFCADTTGLTQKERDEAEQLLFDPDPPQQGPPQVIEGEVK